MSKPFPILACKLTSISIKIPIKRIDKSLPLPRYETAGSVGFDLFCRKGAVVKPKEIKLIPANIIVKTPPGYMLLLALRSSTPAKRGLMLANGIGVIDQDYSGLKDEIKIQVYNFSKNRVKVERGERIAQGIFVKVGKADWQEIKKTTPHSRGGFGSTG